MFFNKKKANGAVTQRGADAAPPKPAAAAAAPTATATAPVPTSSESAPLATPAPQSPAPQAETAQAPGAAASKLPPGEMKRRADYSRGLMQAFGSIMAVYLRSKAHRDTKLSDIEIIVGPAISTGQFLLAEATRAQNGLVTPIAAILWACVSPAIDKRIAADPSQPMALTAAEWKSGDIIWIVDAIGDQATIGTMIKNLQDTAWKGRTVRMRAQQSEGARIVAHTLMQAQSATA